jgi:hypothetical protein
MSFSQQAAWQTFADSHPITDSLGQTINLTGHQMFVAINTQLQNCLQPQVIVPPLSAATQAPVLTLYTAVGSTGVITLTLDGSGAANNFILVAFARPQSSGRSFVSAFWQCDVLPGDSVGNATEGTKVVAQFGALPVGSRLFVKLTPVNQDGFTGVPLIQQCTIG